TVGRPSYNRAVGRSGDRPTTSRIPTPRYTFGSCQGLCIGILESYRKKHEPPPEGIGPAA
ncbi:MAG TPA: hypothetical protein VFA67_01130, partial [Candidatus Sulfotelmatobacter sp.]|nr:hypothetical protein [Candidatus Sulfotelmatobacter sp.]